MKVKLLIATAALLVGCTGPQQITTSTLTDEKPDDMCVAGYVENSPGKGTIDIFYASDYAPNIQSIEDVSIETAEEVTAALGLC